MPLQPANSCEHNAKCNEIQLDSYTTVIALLAYRALVIASEWALEHVK